MTETTQPEFDEIVEELTRCTDSRTWSIIVTIFGDLAQNPMDEISGPLLSSLTSKIGIKPQAMRVALHRLRRDGWIITEKLGRTSKHRLSNFGLEQSAVASPRIYARELKQPESWHLLVTNPEAQKTSFDFLSHGYLSVRNGVYIGKGSAPKSSTEHLIIEGKLSTIPDWLKKSVADTETAQAYDQLIQKIFAVDNILEGGFIPSPMETAIIRTLIVHNWRRIVLRQSDLSVELLQMRPSAQCRELVWKMLNRLDRPSISTLNLVFLK